MPLQLVQFRTIATKPGMASGAISIGTRTEFCPWSAKYWFIAPGDFTCTMGLPMMATTAVVPITSMIV